MCGKMPGSVLESPLSDAFDMQPRAWRMSGLGCHRRTNPESILCISQRTSFHKWEPRAPTAASKVVPRHCTLFFEILEDPGKEMRTHAKWNTGSNYRIQKMRNHSHFSHVLDTFQTAKLDWSHSASSMKAAANCQRRVCWKQEIAALQVITWHHISTHCHLWIHHITASTLRPCDLFWAQATLARRPHVEIRSNTPSTCDQARPLPRKRRCCQSIRMHEKISKRSRRGETKNCAPTAQPASLLNTHWILGLPLRFGIC